MSEEQSDSCNTDDEFEIIGKDVYGSPPRLVSPAGLLITPAPSTQPSPQVSGKFDADVPTVKTGVEEKVSKQKPSTPPAKPIEQHPLPASNKDPKSTPHAPEKSLLDPDLRNFAASAKRGWSSMRKPMAASYDDPSTRCISLPVGMAVPAFRMHAELKPTSSRLQTNKKPPEISHIEEESGVLDIEVYDCAYDCNETPIETKHLPSLLIEHFEDFSATCKTDEDDIYRPDGRLILSFGTKDARRILDSSSHRFETLTFKVKLADPERILGVTNKPTHELLVKRKIYKKLKIDQSTLECKSEDGSGEQRFVITPSSQEVSKRILQLGTLELKEKPRKVCDFSVLPPPKEAPPPSPDPASLRLSESDDNLDDVQPTVDDHSEKFAQESHTPAPNLTEQREAKRPLYTTVYLSDTTGVNHELLSYVIKWVTGLWPNSIHYSMALDIASVELERTFDPECLISWEMRLRDIDVFGVDTITLLPETVQFQLYLNNSPLEDEKHASTLSHLLKLHCNLQGSVDHVILESSSGTLECVIRTSDPQDAQTLFSRCPLSFGNDGTVTLLKFHDEVGLCWPSIQPIYSGTFEGLLSGTLGTNEHVPLLRVTYSAQDESIEEAMRRLKLLLENPKRTGGDKIKEIRALAVNDNRFLIQYETPTVAERVHDQHSAPETLLNLNGQPIKLELIGTKLAKEHDDKAIRIEYLPDSVGNCHLRAYLQALSGVEVKDMRFCEEHKDRAVVQFKDKIDFKQLRPRIQVIPVDGESHLEIQPELKLQKLLLKTSKIPGSKFESFEEEVQLRLEAQLRESPAGKSRDYVVQLKKTDDPVLFFLSLEPLDLSPKALWYIIMNNDDGISVGEITCHFTPYYDWLSVDTVNHRLGATLACSTDEIIANDDVKHFLTDHQLPGYAWFQEAVGSHQITWNGDTFEMQPGPDNREFCGTATKWKARKTVVEHILQHVVEKEFTLHASTVDILRNQISRFRVKLIDLRNGGHKLVGLRNDIEETTDWITRREGELEKIKQDISMPACVWKYMQKVNQIEEIERDSRIECKYFNVEGVLRIHGVQENVNKATRRFSKVQTDLQSSSFRNVKVSQQQASMLSSSEFAQNIDELLSTAIAPPENIAWEISNLDVTVCASSPNTLEIGVEILKGIEGQYPKLHNLDQGELDVIDRTNAFSKFTRERSNHMVKFELSPDRLNIKIFAMTVGSLQYCYSALEQLFGKNVKKTDGLVISTVNSSGDPRKIVDFINRYKTPVLRQIEDKLSLQVLPVGDRIQMVGAKDNVANAKIELTQLVQSIKVEVIPNETLAVAKLLGQKVRDIEHQTGTVLAIEKPIHNSATTAGTGTIVYQAEMIDGPCLEVMKTDITCPLVDAIVNAANARLHLGGGVAGRIKEKGGPAIQKNCDDIMERRSGKSLQPGECAVTEAGNLTNCRFILHAVGPNARESDFNTLSFKDQLSKTVQQVLRKAKDLNLKTLAMPAISCGLFSDNSRFSVQKAITVIVETIYDSPDLSNLKKLILVEKDNEKVLKYFQAAIEKRQPNKSKKSNKIASGINRVFGTRGAAAANPVLPLHSRSQAAGYDSNATSTPAANYNTTFPNGSKLLLSREAVSDLQVQVVFNSIGTDTKVRAGAFSKSLDDYLSKLNINMQSDLDTVLKGNGAGSSSSSPLFAAIAAAVLLGASQSTTSPKVQSGAVIPTQVDSTRVPFRQIIHCITPQSSQGLEAMIIDGLKEAARGNYTSVALPAFGTGNLKMDANDVAIKMYTAIEKYCVQNLSTTIKEIVILIYRGDAGVWKAFENQWKAKFASHVGPSAPNEPSRPTPQPFNLFKHPPEDGRTGFGALGMLDDHSVTIRGTQIVVERKDIFTVPARIIVNITNDQMTHQDPYSSALYSKLDRAGQRNYNEAVMPEKGFVITEASGFNNHFFYILHMNIRKYDQSDKVGWKKFLHEILAECEKERIPTIAFPAIGTGHTNGKHAKRSEILLKGICTYFSGLEQKSLITNVHVAILPEDGEEKFKSFTEAMQKELKKIKRGTNLTKVLSDADINVLNQPRYATNPTIKVYSTSSKANEVRECLDRLRLDVQEWTYDRDIEHLAKYQLHEIKDTVVSKDCEFHLTRRKQKVTIHVSGLAKDLLNVKKSVDDIIHARNRQRLDEQRALDKAEIVHWEYQNGERWMFVGLHPNLRLEETYKSGDEANKGIVFEETDDMFSWMAFIEGNPDDWCGVSDQITGPPFRLRRMIQGDKLPKSWDTSLETYSEHCLRPGTAEHTFVEQAFRKTLQRNGNAWHRSPISARIHEIKRIQHPKQYLQFVMEQEKVAASLGRSIDAVTKCQVWHGSDAETIRKITRSNFNRSYSGRNATLFGNGCYFARDSGYSYKYAHPDGHGIRQMIMAKIVVGDSTVGNSSMKAAPYKADKVTPYNSTVDQLPDPTMFVVYSDPAAYQEYVVKFF